MKSVERKDLHPGQVFSVPWSPNRWAPGQGAGDIFVVVDAKTEVGFWFGHEYRIGDMAPSMIIEVVS